MFQQYMDMDDRREKQSAKPTDTGADDEIGGEPDDEEADVEAMAQQMLEDDVLAQAALQVQRETRIKEAGAAERQRAHDKKLALKVASDRRASVSAKAEARFSVLRAAKGSTRARGDVGVARPPRADRSASPEELD